MKKVVLGIVALSFLILPLQAADQFSIEVLQVSNVAAFDETYAGMIAGLTAKGLIEGQNLNIKRTILDAEADANLFEKVGILMKIKKSADEIVSRKPDLVVTLTTPATKYSRKKFTDAGIPMIFTVVAIPEEVGCGSKYESGPGFSGVTIYQDPTDVIQVAQLALPNIKTLGIIHSDDDNAIAFTEEAQQKAALLGITVKSKQIKKSDRITASIESLIAEGVDSFLIPIDVYYGLRNFEAVNDLRELSYKHKVPFVSAVKSDVTGPIMYMAPDFELIGGLTADQIAAVLLDGKQAGDLPVLKQERLDVYVHLATAEKLGIELPLEIFKFAKAMDK